jgi:GMP synthase PP-ATPase subunit
MEESKVQSASAVNSHSASGVTVTTKNLVKFANHVDPHLMLTLINDAIETKAFSERSLQSQKLKILMNTFLIDEAKKTAAALGDISQIEKLQEAVENRKKQVFESVAKALKLESQDNLSQNVLGKSSTKINNNNF